MQYTIMKQTVLNSNRVYSAALNESNEPCTYPTVEEATTKLEELKASDPDRIYYIESYPDETMIGEGE